MITPPRFNEQEFEELYERLLYQHGNAFFCVTMDTPAFHVVLAEKMRERFNAGEVQIIDFGKVDVRYSSMLVQSLIEDGVKYVFLANFQLANGYDVDDAMFFQVLNFSRDALAELPVVLVFMMPMYFRVQIAQGAPDFNSFFVYRADFVGGLGDVELPAINRSEPYSEANRQLLIYYVERYNSMTEFESRQVFDTLTMILALNHSIRMLSSIEQARFYENFRNLLPQYQEEPDVNPDDIARVFYSQGDYDIAREWHLKNLFILEETLDKDHPEIANTYSNIALIYERQRDYDSALDWYNKALAIYEELDEESISTAVFYSNIAQLHNGQGDYDNALKLHFKALAIFEELLSKEHPYIPISYNEVAGVYAHKNNFPKALEWYDKALTNHKNIQGEEHPNTATCHSNIAWVCCRQGDYNRALELYLKSYMIFLKKLGNSHHDTYNARRGMELAYQAAALPEPFEEWLDKNLNPKTGD